MEKSTKLLSLEELEIIVRKKAKTITAKKETLPTFGYSKDFAYPYLEVDSKGYHYIIAERGKELRHDCTMDLNTFLFWIFEDVTWTIAMEYELNNRIDNIDSRRLSFAKQEELLGKIDKKWQAECYSSHLKILEKNPYDDNVHKRLVLYTDIKNSGISEKKAWKLACEKYPTFKGSASPKVDK